MYNSLEWSTTIAIIITMTMDIVIITMIMKMRTIFKPINDNLKTNPLLNDSKTISVIQKILDKNDH